MSEGYCAFSRKFRSEIRDYNEASLLYYFSKGQLFELWIDLELRLIWEYITELKSFIEETSAI